MRLIILIVFILLNFNFMNAQDDNEIRLLIRGDDIGSFHAANKACIESYKNGIMRSVEIMVPCPWYPEAVELLNENPGLDVGVHLVMTSEWDAMKWRPLIGYSSITDEDGYFFPMVWPNENYPPERSFKESDWHFNDVERELRAQIELAKKDIRNLSHITTHMGFTSADDEIRKLVESLAKEYDLFIDLEKVDLKRLGFDRDKKADFKSQEKAFADHLRNLEPGTYIFVEHPSLDTPEMENIGHGGNSDVGYEREGVTRIFTAELVKQVIKERNIKLISYQDLKR
jgi:hypothetical protein